MTAMIRAVAPYALIIVLEIGFVAIWFAVATLMEWANL